MKAMVCHKYGPPESLQFLDVEKPEPKDDEVCVRIAASSVNAADLDMLKGQFMVRMASPFRPQYPILGSDIAGTIVAAGERVETLHIGDDVFGDLTGHGFGAFAEYVCVSEHAVCLKPECLSFAEAAAVPTAGGVAYLNLLHNRAIKPSDRILVNGAGGGMGTFALQIAKTSGAEVTGVDSTIKLETMRSAGADHVIDYTVDDFTKGDSKYDLVLDVAAYHPLSDCKRALKPDGEYRFVGGSNSLILRAVLLGPLLSKGSGQKMGVVMKYPDIETLNALRTLLEDRVIKPIVDCMYSLADLPEALRHVEKGRALGKVVVRIGR